MAVAEKIEKLEELLNGHVNGKVLRHVVTRLTPPGENYMSLILKVDVTVENGQKEKILSTVAKLVPPAQLGTEALYDLPMVAFRNEIDWYENVVPVLQEFEKEYVVEGLTDIYPQYYGGRLNLEPGSDKIDENAVILLEYLQDYKNGDRLVGFDFETSKQVLRALAKLHGVPMALRQHRRKEFDEKILPYMNRRMKGPGPKDDFCQNLIETLKGYPEALPWIPRCKEALTKDPFETLNLEYREPWATTVHSDFWTNNVMLRITPGVPNVKILDYQIVLCKSFAMDLVFFLLTSVENSVQKTRLDELIRYYYDQLIEVLKQFKVNTDQFKYEDYLKELEIEAREGEYTHAVRFINIIYIDRGTVPDVMLKMDEEIFKNIMSTKTPRIMEKQFIVTKICAERNWI